MFQREACDLVSYRRCRRYFIIQEVLILLSFDEILAAYIARYVRIFLLECDVKEGSIAFMAYVRKESEANRVDIATFTLLILRSYINSG